MSGIVAAVVIGLAAGIAFVTLFALFAYTGSLKSAIPDDTKIMKEIAATRDLPEVVAFLKTYPNSIINVTTIGERTVQVSYIKEVYLTNYNNDTSTRSSSMVENGSIISNINNNAARGRAIALSVNVDSITFNPSNSVVSCYPINGGVDADSARGADMIPFILESKTRCFGGMMIAFR